MLLLPLALQREALATARQLAQSLHHQRGDRGENETQDLSV